MTDLAHSTTTGWSFYARFGSWRFS